MLLTRMVLPCKVNVEAHPYNRMVDKILLVSHHELWYNVCL